MVRKWIPPLIIVLVLSLLIAFFLLNIKLKASILELAEATAQIRAVEIINHAVYEKIVKGTEYQDIVYIHKDGEGKIVMIQANTVVLNQIMAKTISAVVEGLNSLREETIEVPLGQVTGSIILAAYGPKMQVNIIPTKQVTIYVDNKFEQAGINQTRHQIYLKIVSKIKIAVPLLEKTINVSANIPLAETIIVGDVPQTYVDFKGNDANLYPLLNQSKGD